CRVISDDSLREANPLARRNERGQLGLPLQVRPAGVITPVGIEEVKGKKDQWEFLRMLLYCMLPLPLHRHLEREEFPGLFVDSNRFSFENDFLCLHLPPDCCDEFWEHQRHALEVPGEHLHLVPTFMALEAEAVVLPFDPTFPQSLHDFAGGCDPFS